MKRHHAAVLAAVIALALALWTWSRRAIAPGTNAPRSSPENAVIPDASRPSPEPVRGDFSDGSLGPPPPARTVRDVAVRDALRRQLFLAWQQPSTPVTTDPLHAPMPTLDGGGVDPAYLQARIREDFLPMAQQCYEQLLRRAPGWGGRVPMEFVLLGDERVGGVVDEARIVGPDGGTDAEAEPSGLGDGEFRTCLRESMMAMAFAPPPGRGSLRVRYPFRFSPDDDAGARDP